MYWSKIPRGTLGTGAPLVHDRAGSDVLQCKFTANCPYVDSTIVENFIGDNPNNSIWIRLYAQQVLMNLKCLLEEKD